MKNRNGNTLKNRLLMGWIVLVTSVLTSIVIYAAFLSLIRVAY